MVKLTGYKKVKTAVFISGTVQNFINIMKNEKYDLNTQKKVWMIE